MKQFIDLNGNPINEKLTVKKMLEIAIMQQISLFPQLSVMRVLNAAALNVDKIVKTIERSMTHNMAQLDDSSEIHFIALVDGKAKCVRSMGLTTGGQGFVQFNFVWSKEWTEKTIKNFVDDSNNTESVWSTFNFVLK